MINKFRDKFLLEIVVFVSGAVVMIYEVIGSRILAPYIGTSTYVWTSLIGVILGSLSLGYWFGGRMADRQPNSKILSLILFASSILVTVTIILQEFVLLGISLLGFRLELKAVIASIILFAPASILFGMVTPYAIRLKVVSVEETGKTVGRLYALSTIGSILGTFSAGFLLLPFVGSVRTLYIIAAVLFLLSLIIVPFKITVKKSAAILLFLTAIGANEFIRYTLQKNYDLHDFDTQYNRVRVWSSVHQPTNQRIRVMAFDPFSTQSAMFLDSEEQGSKYLQYYHLLRHFKPDFQKTLNIGGAGYSFPKDYLKKYPDKQIDVVEIDPQLTQIAKDYFRLKENPNLQIFHEDGRTFLNQTKNKYDVIIIDAFGSTLSVPFQLTTIEAVRKINSALTDDGVVIINLISSIEGDTSYFFQSEYKTYSEVFPQMFLFKIIPGSDTQSFQNLILIGSKSNKISLDSNDPEIAELLKTRHTEPLNLTMPVLTDELAPIEYYTSFAQKNVGLNQDKLKSRVSSLINKVFGGK